jgi:hypothetical protein
MGGKPPIFIMNDINPTAKSILDTALTDVKQELSIIVDGSLYLVYVQNIDIDKTGRMVLSLSTPHDLDLEMKERVFGYAYDAVSAQIKEGLSECQSRSLFSRISSTMKNIFAKFSRS